MRKFKLSPIETYKEYFENSFPEMKVSCDDVRDMFEDRLINLSDDDIKATWKDYSRIGKGYTHDNPITLMHLMDEGINMSYPIDKTIQYVQDYFELPDEYIKKLSKNGNDEQILIWFPHVGTNVKEMKRAMNLCGYYLGRPKDEDLKPNQYQWLQFEKIKQEDITKQLRKEEEFLYHITPKYNVHKIKNIGFSPRCRHEQFNYPDRVYFLRGSAPDDVIKSLIKDLYKNNHSKGKVHGGYVIMTIDLDKVPDRVVFHDDANASYAVFTRDNISYDVITDIKDIDIKDGEVQGW